jgi:hypothetical protein
VHKGKRGLLVLQEHKDKQVLLVHKGKWGLLVLQEHKVPQGPREPKDKRVTLDLQVRKDALA